MTYEAVSFLFPGDAEEEQEAMLLEHSELKESLSANVLKVSHHGSDTSSSRAFLDAGSPEWMVISAGKKNVGTNKSFMHPRLATINNLMTFARCSQQSQVCRCIRFEKEGVGKKIDMGKSFRNGERRPGCFVLGRK
jgi:competence protein ComEC